MTEDQAFVFGIFLSVMAFFVVLNVLNPDAFVTMKNRNQFVKNGELDTQYFSLLSADAVPELLPLLEMPGVMDKQGNPVAKEVAALLQKFHDSGAKPSWQSYNFSRNRAQQLIDSKWDRITSILAQE